MSDDKIRWRVTTAADTDGAIVWTGTGVKAISPDGISDVPTGDAITFYYPDEGGAE